MQEYCSVPYASDVSDLQINSTESFGGPSVDLEKVSIGSHPHEDLVEFHNQNFGWKDVKNPVLRNIDLSIKHGAFTAIVGPVGSGKSTLLESILGESLATEGSAKRNFATIGYCSQTPWLQSHTVRENIIGNMDFDKDWYKTVIWACGIEEDLSRLAQGDKTPVGSNGLNLSGGQKQRIVSQGHMSDYLFLDSETKLKLKRVWHGLYTHGAELLFLTTSSVGLMLQLRRRSLHVYLKQTGSFEI